MAARGNHPRKAGRDAGPEVVIVGGGITGLSTAWSLLRHSRSPKVVVLESAARPGGQIRTEHDGDHLFECGPDSLVSHKPAGAELCREAGLGDDLIHPDPGHGGIQVVHRGRLVDLPEGFMMMAPTRFGPLFRSPLFSWRGKLRIAAEPLVPRKRKPGDEALAAFVRRRFGREALDRAAEPILGALYIADADRLSLQMTMPRFLELEQRHGSVIVGMRRGLRRRKGPPPPPMVSLRAGMQSLVERLVKRLPPGCVQVGAHVERVARDAAHGRWRVRVSGRPELTPRAVVLACPTFIAAKLLERVDRNLADELAAPAYASCATVNLVYRKTDLRRPIERFGFFVPRTEGLPLLAGSHVSVKFAGRVPDDRVLVRAFLGGALHPGLLDRSDEELEELSDRKLRELLGIAGAPLARATHRFPRSLPQFDAGHAERIDRAQQSAAALPGLILGGGAVGAIGIPDCILSGRRAAQAALEVLERAPRQLELAI